MADTYLGIFSRPDLFEVADYFQLNAAEALVKDDKATRTHTKTSYGAAYEIVRDVFENSDRLESRIDSSKIIAGLDAVSTDAVIQDGKLTVIAVNRTTRNVPLSVKFDGVVYEKPFKHQAFAFKWLNEFPSFAMKDSALADITPKTGGIVLPPLSISRIDGLVSASSR